jgi:hypothetical protein
MIDAHDLMVSTASTLRADQQDCQNGLALEDHSGGFGVWSAKRA